SEGAISLPVTTLTTPGGKPASFMSSTMRSTPSGSCGAGLMTTVLPMARAGPILPDMLVIGTLYEVMQVTTPTGARCTAAEISPPGASGVVGITAGGSGSMWDRNAPLA